MHCLCVDPAQVHKVWPLVWHLIRAAMNKGGGCDFAEMERSILAGEKLLWVAADEATLWAAVITGLHIQQDHKFCMIWAAGGHERERWHSIMKVAIEKFAKDEGCKTIRISGRRGWAREFPEYKLISVVLEKVI